jgi:hypothetical protein
MSPARERRPSELRAGDTVTELSGLRGLRGARVAKSAIGFEWTVASRDADFLREPAGLLPDGLLPDGLRDLGGFFDKCLEEK